MKRLLLLLLVMVLVNGCGTRLVQEQDANQLSIEESIQQAELLRKQRLYSEAENLLLQADKHYPSNTKPRQLLDQILMERQRHQQLIEDKLLAARLSLLQQQRPLLAELAKSEADDLMIRSHLQQLEKEWRESRPLLSSCGERQLKMMPDVAEKCLRLSLAIEEQKIDRKRLTELEQKKAKAAKKRQQKKREVQIQQLLAQARNKWKTGERYDALVLLERLLKLAPESASAINLKGEIQAELEGHSKRLLSVGEALYQGGHIEGALAVWNTLLLLNPQHKQALQKIERAQRVLGNLQQLRQQQRPTASKAE